MPFPQLRIRSGFSFQEAYGRIPEVIDRLKEIGTNFACLVDTNGTWGHVKWEKELSKAGIVPGFGMEIPIQCDDIEDPKMHRFTPRAFIIAKDLRAFYNATTSAVQNGGMFREQLRDLEGVVRFSGGAIDRLHPDDFDFIDINPSSLLLAAKGVAYHRKYGKPMVITSFNLMPKKEDANFAYAWRVRESVSPCHILTKEELIEALSPVMTEDELLQAIANTEELPAVIGEQKLNKAPIIHLEGDLVALAREGAKKRLESGHIEEWTDVYEDRFNEEIRQIQLKSFDSYFLCVADLIQYAKKHMLVGPARGSSAGSLICYCLSITEVDPIPHKLLFQRFIDISREDFPDIDIDFPDTKRYMILEYLIKKYGSRNVSKMGNVNQLRAASAIAQVAHKFLVPINETSTVRQSLIDYKAGDSRFGFSLRDTFDTTPAGETFKRKWSSAADCMAKIELHPSHTGVHAAAILVCNDPISDFCTVNKDGVAQIDKNDAEYLNLLKIDALGLRTLGVIEDSGVVTSEELYNLKFDDPKVYEVFQKDALSGVFQFEGGAVRGVTRQVNVNTFSMIDNLTALARPGPLGSGMAQKYIERANGREKISYETPHLEPYLSETKGVFLYQEQIMMVVRELGGFDWARTSEIRKGMSKSKGSEFFAKHVDDFVKGAVSKGVDPGVARYIWEEMVMFGSYGFNKSHSVSYAVITYWCCWMKVYHPLEFAAASLRSAKDDQQTIAILRELEAEKIGYTPIDPDFSLANWTVADGRLIGGIMNAKGFGPVLAARYIEGRNKGILTAKQREKLLNAEVKFADLHEAHTKFGFAYEDPSAIGVTSGMEIQDIKDIEDREDCLFICKLVKKELLDENDSIRLRRRGGKRVVGETQFLDLRVVDDSVDLPVRVRIKPDRFQKFGVHISENVPKGAWFLVKAWKIPDCEMFIARNIKQIDDSREKVPVIAKPKISRMDQEDDFPLENIEEEVEEIDEAEHIFLDIAEGAK